jgi:hypothetical protein
MPKFVRPRPDQTVVLRHPESGALAAPNPAVPLPDNDPLVKAFPWAFITDEELAAEQQTAALAFRESAIESARRADAQLAARDRAAKDAEADAVKMAEARAAGKPQGDDAKRDLAAGERVDDDGDVVESATARPGERRVTRARKTAKKARKG